LLLKWVMRDNEVECKGGTGGLRLGIVL
jgi:hypothetical protein